MPNELTEVEKHYLSGLLNKQITWTLLGNSEKVDEVIALTKSICKKLDLPE